MKKFRDSLLGAVALAAAQAASAQATLYGVVDASLRYQNNTNTSTSSLMSLTPGAYGASRFGVRGREDLGGGLYATFQLEQGFNPDNGTAFDASRAFNRHAWVGLGGDWGRVSAGRQYTLAHEVLGMNMYDVLGVGGYDETAWFVGSQYALRNDNSLKYRHTLNGVEVGLMYALSEAQGVGASFGAMVMAPLGALSVGLTHQTDKAATGKRTTNLVALKYKLSGGTTLHGYTMVSNDRRGVQRKDRLYSVGAIHPLTAKLTLSGVLYRNLSETPATGSRSAAAIRAQYALSKRTEVYVETDRTRVSGITLSALNGAGKVGSDRSRSTVSVGMKHVF